MALTRRSALIGLPGLSAAMLGTRGRAQEQEAVALSSPPEADLDTIIQIRGHRSLPFWLWFEGIVYGCAPDDPLRPLFGFSALLRVRYGQLPDGTTYFEQRESAHYNDLKSGETAGEFYNPYLDRNNIAIGYVSPLLRFAFSIEGTFDIRSGRRIGTLMPALIGDEAHIWTTERRANEFASNIDPTEFPDAYRTKIRRSADIATYRARVEDLAATDFVPATTDIVADTPWPLWMFMSDLPGHVVWIGHGKKALDIEDVPAGLKARVERGHPGFLEAPWDIDGSPYSTGHQMRQLRATGRI